MTKRPWSDLKCHPVSSDDDARALHGAAFRRIFDQDRARIVDVRVHLVTAREPPEAAQGTRGPADGRVTHLHGGAVAQANALRLVVGEKGAVEERNVRACETAGEGVVEGCRPWDERAGPAGGAIVNEEAHRVTGLVREREARRVACHLDGLEREAARRPVAV